MQVGMISALIIVLLAALTPGLFITSILFDCHILLHKSHALKLQYLGLRNLDGGRTFQIRLMYAQFQDPWLVCIEIKSLFLSTEIDCT